MTQLTQTDNKRNFLLVLIANWQTQIAEYYNQDKTDEERSKRNAIIEEYQYLIAIYKQGESTVAPDKDVWQNSKAMAIVYWNMARSMPQEEFTKWITQPTAQ
jgi:hypothetical protein